MSTVGALFLRLKKRRKVDSPLEILRLTILLDPIWYRESHIDLRGTSIDAAQHYLDYGAREGRNPHPLFDTKWYLSRTPDAAASSLNPLVHYLLREVYAGSCPHPLFDVDLYISNAQDLESSRLDPLTHYLTIGWKQGIHPNKFFDPGWYLEQNPDVRAAGIEPLSHYLQWGWREDRRPNSTIDPIAYRERNGLTKVTNPLLDFALFGEKRSTQESPSNQDSGDSLRRKIPSKKRDVDIVSPESKQTVVTAGSVKEPGIRPPLPVAIIDSQQHARDIEIVSAIRALRLKNRDDIRGSMQRLLREDEIKIISAKLELAGADNVLPLDSVSAAVRESANANGNGGRVALNALLGLGITPHHTIDQDCFPPYPVPILNRYNQGRLDAHRRFSLNPSLAGSIDRGPTISILVPVYKTSIMFLERAILSVLFQTYANWELILVDDFSQRSDIEALLEYYASVDPRVKVFFCKEKGGISAATNEALRIASGSYIGLLDHDDMLTGDALERVADCLVKNDELDFVYTDECKIDCDDLVDDLFHKPDWSPLLLLNLMYTGHFSVYRKSLVESIDGFRSKFDLSQDYDLVLRVAERQPKVMHIEEILYGWRMIPGSGSVGDKPTARLTNIAALQDAADRRGYDGVAIALPTANRVKRSLMGRRPLVSIIVPSDNFSNIRDSVDSIVSHTTYGNYEILVVTNSKLIATDGDRLASPTIRLIKYDEPYNFSDKCNAGAACANGEHVVFFNDDVRVISPDWIETLLEYLTLPGVGAVGPKLIYENGSIQHAGMVTGVRRLVGTAFHAYPADTTAYFNFAQSVRETSLISAACLAMPMEVFLDIGGFDPGNVPIAHSDVDLCFRVRESGRNCVYTPHAQLTHIGHLSIGSAEAEEKRKAKPFQKDKADLFLLKKWGRYLERDPYFPPKMKDLVYIDSQETFRYFAGRPVYPQRGPDVLIVSHDLTGSGAPRLVYEMTRVLIDRGCFVAVISPEDGIFRQTLLDLGAHVIVDPLALAGHKMITDLGKNFDLVIANTAVCWPVVTQLAPFAPIYWYIHETQLIRSLADKNPEFVKSFAHAKAVWVGSKHSSDFLCLYGIGSDILEYGVDDPREHSQFSDKVIDPSEIVISVLATSEPRKGQDLAILGFLAMPEDRRNRCRLRLAGRINDSEFHKTIEALAAGCERIDFDGELDYQTYLDRMRASDIVLCASRDDTLPLVSLNALAEGKVLVCSQETGTSRYIRDGISGFVIARNGPEGVAETLTRAVDAIESWPAIGIEARSVFERDFSLQKFRSRFLKELGLHEEGPPPTQGQREAHITEVNWSRARKALLKPVGRKPK